MWVRILLKSNIKYRNGWLVGCGLGFWEIWEGYKVLEFIFGCVIKEVLFFEFSNVLVLFFVLVVVMCMCVLYI